MKKQIMLLQNLSASFKPFLFALAISASAPALAQSPTAKPAKADSAHVSYLGREQDNLLFRIFLDNKSGEKFTVLFKDTDDNTLFRETYQEKQFDKLFQLNRPELSSSVTVVIKPFKSSKQQVFRINTSIQLVEEVTVRKL